MMALSLWEILILILFEIIKAICYVMNNIAARYDSKMIF